MLEIRTKIFQPKVLCTKTCKIKKKQDKSLRGTVRTGQYAHFDAQQFCDHSEASVG